MKWPTDDDDSCTGQQSEQGEEHHLVAVYEAVQGVAPLHVNNWSSSCKKRAVDETKGCQNLFKVLRTYNMLKKIFAMVLRDVMWSLSEAEEAPNMNRTILILQIILGLGD